MESSDLLILFGCRGDYAKSPEQGRGRSLSRSEKNVVGVDARRQVGAVVMKHARLLLHAVLPTEKNG